jgi:phage-related protein
VARPIRIAILADARNALRGIGQTESALGKLGRGAGAALGGVAKIAAGAAAAIGTIGVAAGVGAFKLGGMASEAEQSFGAVQSVLGKSAKQFQRWTDANAAAYGITEQVANQAGATYAALGKNLGIAEEDLADFGIRGIQTAADMAAAFGGDTTEALDALGAGLRGEFDQLEQYGVKLSADLVARKAAAEGITDAAATELLIQEQLGGVIGQNAREHDTWAATTDRIKASIGDILTAAGKIVLPIMTLAAVLAEAIIPAGELESSFERLAGKVEKVTDGLKKTFDDAGGGVEGVKAVGAEIVENVLEWRELITDAVQDSAGGFIDGFAQALPSILSGVLGALVAIINGIAAVLPQILSAVADIALQIVDALVDLLPGLIDAILGLLPALLEAAVELFTAIIDGLILVVPLLLQSITDILPLLLETIVAMIPDLLRAGVDLLMALVNAVLLVLPDIIDAVLGILPEITAVLVEMIPELTAAAILLFLAIAVGLVRALPEIVKSIIDMWPDLVDAFLGAIPSLKQAGVYLIEGLVDGLAGEWATGANQWGEDRKQAVKNWMTNAWYWIWGAGSDIINGFLAGLQAAWGSVTSFISGIGPWIAAHKGPKAYDLGLLVKNGGWIMQGLRDGIEGEIPALQRTLGAVASVVAGTDMGQLGAGAATTLKSAAQRLALEATATPSSGAAGEAPVVISFERTGDSLLDAVVDELRKHIRVNGGDVQTVLGRA